jgi:signal transduction histidine kinase/NO-binding membrane sensor protein with MHYT domain/ActR/RegA family two-component response regulator
MDAVLYGHDWRLSLLAVAFCFAGMASTLQLIELTRRRDVKTRWRLAVAAGIVASLTTWVAHVLAMKALAARLGGTYDVGLALGSSILAMAMIGLAVVVALARGRLWRTFAGLIALSGVAAMHYLGMVGFQASGRMEWRSDLVVLSIVGGMAIAGATAFLHRRGSLPRLLLSAGGAVAAIMFLHVMGTAALSVTPDPAAGRQAALSPEAMRPLIILVFLAVGGTGGVIGVMAYMTRAGALARIREAVEAMPDGLAFFDADDRLVLWNARYAQVNPELGPLLKVGTPFLDLIRIGMDEGRYDDAIGREDEWIAERLRARRAASSFIEQQVAGDRWLRIQDRRTAEGGTVTVCNDITDLKHDARALGEARDAAEAANVAKSLFLANMSHEIRTPLNGVIGLSQALAKTELTAEQREILDLMQASGQTLRTLLSDILDLARVESGRLELTEDAFELAGAVREAAQLYAENAREKHLGFHVDIDVEDGLWVRGDVVRLKQILTNLISNAVKFTSQGFVGLTVQRGADHARGPTLRFTVEDTGIGFDSATRERLFRRFEQADGGITRKFGGSGLGLSICRQLAEMMGGDLDCESEPGGGSAFILTLPLSVCDAPAQSEPQADPETPARLRRPVRVLVADDHPTNRRVIELILAQTSVELCMVENGAEAVDAFRLRSFDLVLMDMQMPVMDGLTATREIRLHESATGAARTPIVMLTANAMPEHVAAGRSAGADHHLAKPFNAAELLAIVIDPAALPKIDAQAA